ncbi:BC1872 family protein [Paenibacillus sp. BAC0078]
MTLTREEILSKTPGPKLDELVSHEILAYDIYRDFPVNAIYTGDTATSFRVFQPSIYMSHTWEVVNYIQTEYSVIVQREGDAVNVDGMWEVEISGYRPSVKARTAQEAICKAALLAVLNL